jgi:hypothetical protein
MTLRDERLDDSSTRVNYCGNSPYRRKHDESFVSGSPFPSLFYRLLVCFLGFAGTALCSFGFVTRVVFGHEKSAFLIWLPSLLLFGATYAFGFWLILTR